MSGNMSGAGGSGLPALTVAPPQTPLGSLAVHSVDSAVEERVFAFTNEYDSLEHELCQQGRKLSPIYVNHHGRVLGLHARLVCIRESVADARLKIRLNVPEVEINHPQVLEEEATRL